jgi:YD repeat-containing protein
MQVSRTVCSLSVLFCLAPIVSDAQLQRLAPLESQKSVSYENSRREKFVPGAEKGIREVVADRYKKRYDEWKTEFLSTDFGRAQWDAYEHNTQFVLTVTVSGENSRGGGTSKYKWDESGRLVEATVTFGSNMSKGFPNPVYYPVMSSLAPGNSSFLFSGTTLAAAKIAHEFGHLNRMQQTNAAMYRLQSQLIPQYNSILLSNGLNTRDPRLVAIAKQMGGTPVEI